MDKRKISISGSLLALLNLTLIVVIAGCQPANMSSNANSPGNTNAPAANSNSTSTTTTNSDTENSGVRVNVREPERYSANLQFSIETEGGDKAIGIPTLSIQVARNGDDQRVEFKLPDGSPLIYLDHNNHHYVIAPARKQYAELSPEATGFQLHKLLTPGQLVADLKDLKGVEHAGEGLINGRAAEKYRYSASTKTNTKAGEVKAEAFVYVDKETGLPLRTELNAESSGDVKGVKAARVVAEMRDINTEIAPALFDLPAGYAAVAPEKVRQQIDALTEAVATILKAMMSAGSNQPGNSPTPVTSPSPNQ